MGIFGGSSMALSGSKKESRKNMTPEILHFIDLEKQTLGSNFVEQSVGYYLEYCSDEGLTEEEFLTVRMLVSNGEGIIQRHLYAGTEPTELESLLCGHLDSAIRKMHIEDTVSIVYRVLENSEYTVDDIDKVITFPAYLTTSKYCIPVTGYNATYVIRLAGRTQARSLYRVYEITPMMPEWQVEFPRGTKFHIDNVQQHDGQTVVYMTEIPVHVLPVELLSYSITDFFKYIKTIDIQDAVNNGLKSEIKLAKTRNGHVINAACTPEGQVYVSPTFAQAIWNMCYAGLWLADGIILTKEAEKEGSSLQAIYEAIVGRQCTEPECLYIKGVSEAKDWNYMIDKAVAYKRNWNLEDDDIEMGQLDLHEAFNGVIGRLYQAGMGTVLLHELTHFYHNHFHDRQRDRKDKEQEADDIAFDAIQKIEAREGRKAAVIGILSVYLLGFFHNPQLTPNNDYYREDVRLFRQFDKVVEFRKECNILVAYVLSKWLHENHHITIEVEYGNEENAIAAIRDVISKL